MSKVFQVETHYRSEFIDITDKISKVCEFSGKKSGMCFVFIPHTTAGITINENADPDVKSDIIKTLDKIIPWNNNYSHSEGNSAAHIKASLMGFTVQVPFENGKLVLGTWQCVYFCEFDGPRTRKVIVEVIGG